MEEVTMLFTDVDLVERTLDVTSERKRFLSETAQDTNQGVRQIGALQKVAVKGLSLESCRLLLTHKGTLSSSRNNAKRIVTLMNTSTSEKKSRI